MKNVNIDIRTQLSLNIIDSDDDYIKAGKTTRAGFTTSLCIAAMIRQIPFLILEPTNQIIEDTIMEDAKKLSHRKDAYIIHIESNFKCKHNEEKIKKNKDFAQFDYLPLAKNCNKCEHFGDCPITEIRRCESFDGLCITYDKLAALYLTATLYPDSYAVEIVEKLNQIGVVIYDEAHELKYFNTSTLDLWEKIYKEEIEKNELMYVKFAEKFIKKIKVANTKNDNKYIALENVLSNYLEVISSDEINDAISVLEEKFKSADWWKKPHNEKVKNTKLRDTFGTKIKFDYTSRKYEHVDIGLNDVAAETVDELIKITPNRRKYNISMKEIKSVFKILDIVTSKQFDIKARKIKFADDEDIIYDKLTMTIQAINHDSKNSITEFTQEMQAHNKKIILTTATFPEYDYNQLLLEGTEFKDVVFGEDGDPLQTNKKHFLFPDTKSFNYHGKYSTETQFDTITKQCTEIIDLHGNIDCMIFCKNKADYEKYNEYFKNSEYRDVEITYYRSSKSIGVASDKRIIIAIEFPYIPVDSFDYCCDDVGESKVQSLEQMHIAALQALSRNKDPWGQDASITFILGGTLRDTKNICTWGIGRFLEIIPQPRGMQTEINVHVDGERIAPQQVVEVRNWDERLIMSMVHRYGLHYDKSINHYKFDKLLNLQKIELTVDSKSAILQNIFCDSITQLKRSNRTFSQKDKAINEKLMNQHIEGDKNVFYHPVSKNMTNHIMFESDSEIHMSKLKLLLDSSDIPNVIEKLNNKYRLWILIKNIDALEARKFGNWMLKELNFTNNVECILYPTSSKSSKKDGTEDLIRLPFGEGSQILINGEFVDEIKDMDIGIVDISVLEDDFY